MEEKNGSSPPSCNKLPEMCGEDVTLPLVLFSLKYLCGLASMCVCVWFDPIACMDDCTEEESERILLFFFLGLSLCILWRFPASPVDRVAQKNFLQTTTTTLQTHYFDSISRFCHFWMALLVEVIAWENGASHSHFTNIGIRRVSSIEPGIVVVDSNGGEPAAIREELPERRFPNQRRNFREGLNVYC